MTEHSNSIRKFVKKIMCPINLLEFEKIVPYEIFNGLFFLTQYRNLGFCFYKLYCLLQSISNNEE